MIRGTNPLGTSYQISRYNAYGEGWDRRTWQARRWIIVSLSFDASQYTLHQQNTLALRSDHAYSRLDEQRNKNENLEQFDLSVFGLEAADISVSSDAYASLTSTNYCYFYYLAMECSFALTGKGHVIVAADTTAAHSIVKMKINEDKIKTLSPHLLMAYSGEPGPYHLTTFHYPQPQNSRWQLIPGDTIQFAEFVERNIRLYQIRNLYPLRPSAAASWIRRSLADSLRSRKPYSVNLLLGGYDTASHEPSLYWVDYLGTITSVPFAAHGYGSYFALSLLDW